MTVTVPRQRTTFCVGCGDDPTESVVDRAHLLTPLHDHQDRQLAEAWRLFPDSPEERIFWAAMQAAPYRCPYRVTLDGELYTGGQDGAGVIYDILPGEAGFVLADEDLGPCPDCGEPVVLAVYRGRVDAELVV